MNKVEVAPVSGSMVTKISFVPELETVEIPYITPVWGLNAISSISSLGPEITTKSLSKPNASSTTVFVWGLIWNRMSLLDFLSTPYKYPVLKSIAKPSTSSISSDEPLAYIVPIGEPTGLNTPEPEFTIPNWSSLKA